MRLYLCHSLVRLVVYAAGVVYKMESVIDKKNSIVFIDLKT